MLGTIICGAAYISFESLNYRWVLTCCSGGEILLCLTGLVQVSRSPMLSIGKRRFQTAVHKCRQSRTAHRQGGAPGSPKYKQRKRPVLLPQIDDALIGNLFLHANSTMRGSARSLSTSWSEKVAGF